MKIAVNTRFLLSDRILEGVGRYTYEITKRMVISHPEHEYYFLFDRPYSKEFIFSDKVKPITLFPPARHPFLFYIWFEWSVKRFLDKFDIDVFLSFDGFLSLSSNTAQSVVIHDLYYAHRPEHIPYIARRYYQIFMPRFLKKANRIITVSNFVKQDVMERFPEFDNEKISVAYNALPSHFNNKPSIYKPYLDYAYFIVPGSIHPRKNTLNILKAFKKFIEETKLDFKIVFVGRFMWEATQELKLLWKEFAIKKWLIHIEDAEDQDMVNWISFAQALLYISQFEGFGIPILEGFSCKVPVITSDNTSLKEVALDAALKVNPHNVDDIKNAMIKVLNDYDLRQELINKGQVRLQDFDWHKSMEIVYASILSAAASHQHLK